MNDNVIKNIEEIIDKIIQIGFENYKNISNVPIVNPPFTHVELISLISNLFLQIEKLRSNLNLLETIEPAVVEDIYSKLVKINSECQAIKNRAADKSPDRYFSIVQYIFDFYRYLRTYGIYSILNPSSKIVEYEQSISEINRKAVIVLASAEKSENEIAKLLPNATATSMAASIQSRIKGLQCVVFIYLALFIIGIGFLIGQSNKFLEMEKAAIECNFVQIGLEFWLKRLIYIVPAIYLIIFSARQFSKERKLLEIYIHKKTIAQSLPAYMEQATGDKKDEVLLRGTTMIFSLPENPDTPLPGDGISLSDVKDFIKK